MLVTPKTIVGRTNMELSLFSFVFLPSPWLYENQKENNCLEDLRVNGRVILKWIWNLLREGMDYIYLAYDIET